MSKESETTEISEGDAGVHHRSLFGQGDEDPSEKLIETVAELKGVEERELQPLYSWADDLVGELYTSPPPAEAQTVVEFSYEGFRVTLYQDGHAVFANRSTSE